MGLKSRIIPPRERKGLTVVSSLGARYTKMNLKRFSIFLLMICAIFPLVLTRGEGPGLLHASDTAIIQRVKIIGSQRIEPDTVRSYLKLDVGHPFAPEAVRNSLNALFDTGYFKDVSLEREGGDLLVKVVENPMVNVITFEGNEAFDEEELNQIISIKARDIYVRAKTERDSTALRQAYRVKGLFLAKIEVLIKQQDNNQVNLIYRIEEGTKSKVQEVRVIGNKGLSDEELMDKLMIQPSDWLSWYTETDTYDREKLLFDQSQLRNIYLDEGYVRIGVDSSVAELTPDRSAFLITHTVHEGKRYKFGSIQIIGDFKELPEADLYQVLKLQEGEWYSQKKIRDSIEALTDLVGDFGYAFLEIKPERVILDEVQKVGVIFRLNKGRRVYVNRIEVVGNTRTQDNVVRREMTMVEGDLFSASKLRKAKRRLQGLNFFESVAITTPPAGDMELVDVKIKVEEQPTGTFSVGGGYSSQDSFIGTASVSQNNFLGKGQRMVFSLSYSGRETEYNVAFTEPYFLGKRLSAGFDLFNRDVDQSSTSSYDEKSFGGALHLGFPLSDNLRNVITYKFAETDIRYTGAGTASRVLREQEDLSPYLQSMISNSLTWNSVDNRLIPSKGRIHRLTTDVSGLGGDVQFVRAITDHHLYHPLSDNGEWVGHIRGRFGVSESLGLIPIYERFYMGGGNNLRGFVPAGIGPRTEEDDAYGGLHFEQINTELFFPIVGLKDKGVRGLAFVDTAYLGDWDLPEDIGEPGSIRMATGVGVHWNSPFGPLRFTLSTPLMKESYDQTRIFDFAIGSML